MGKATKQLYLKKFEKLIPQISDKKRIPKSSDIVGKKVKVSGDTISRAKKSLLNIQELR